MNKLVLLASLILSLAGAHAAQPRSPENQVFQFSFNGTCSDWSNGKPTKATLYLWVPETSKTLRGLVILATNVPEHMLVNNASIREACRKNDLGLIWSVPTFWNFAKEVKGQEATQVAFLQTLLNGLAEKSGYSEVATVPWFPIGESGHLLMVCGLIDQKPERCIAGICVKNPHHPKDRTVPLLWTLGTAQEWGQTAKDIRQEWKMPVDSYKGWGNGRAETGWPLSVIIEPSTGHFYCTDEMAAYFEKYITTAVQKRLAEDGTLRPVNLEEGFYADLPLPGIEDTTIIPASQATPEQKKRPWFFTEELARLAQDFARTNWSAGTQLPGLIGGENVTIRPFAFNSITEILVTTDSTFSVQPALLDAIPEGFVGAGEKLEKTEGAPTIEWICGQVMPAGENTFRVNLDRTWKTGAATYLILQKAGSDTVRRSVQPVAVKLQENKEGTPQTVTIDPIPDVPAGTASVPFSAKSDSGLPVQVTVLSGPAKIEGDRVVFTPIPPRAKFPVEVTLGAAQWGRPTEPKVKTSDMVRTTFHITAP